jgi:hypothetical protein
MSGWLPRVKRVVFVAGWVVMGLGCIVLLCSIPVFLLVDDLLPIVVVLEMGGMTITNGVLLLVVSYLIKD